MYLISDNMAPKTDGLTLGEYVSRVMNERGVSLRDVEIKSKRGGMKGITRSYIADIKNGFVTNPSPEKLKALARGIDRPEEEIFKVLLRVNHVPREFEQKLLYEAAGAENWNDDQKKRFLQAVSAVAAGIRAERQSSQSHVSPTTEDKRAGIRRASGRRN